MIQFETVKFGILKVQDNQKVPKGEHHNISVTNKSHIAYLKQTYELFRAIKHNIHRNVKWSLNGRAICFLDFIFITFGELYKNKSINMLNTRQVIFKRSPCVMMASH